MTVFRLVMHLVRLYVHMHVVENERVLYVVHKTYLYVVGGYSKNA